MNALIQHRGCGMASEIESGPACAYECSVYRGDMAAGESCPSLPMQNAFLLARFIDPCAMPATCDLYYTMECKPPLPVVGPGEACRGQNAEPTAFCEPGYSCDVVQRNAGCEDRVWICEVVEAVDLFTTSMIPGVDGLMHVAASPWRALVSWGGELPWSTTPAAVTAG